MAPPPQRSKAVLDPEAEAFRPRPRPWVRALGLNFVLLGLLLGVPYARGHRRAEETLSAFPAFAACFFGGTVAPTPGLAVPAGDREAYATLVVRGPPSWPGDCRAPLEAIALEEATFLLPGPKQAEVEVRAAVETMREELDAIEAHRADGVVRERPLQAFARLQAALSTVLQAIGDAHRGSRPAISLDPAVRLPATSRIPLRVADGGVLRAAASAERLRLLTVDSSRASLVEVELALGRVHEALVRRPRAARGTALDAHSGYLVFLTSPTACSTDPFSCARRLSGFARVRDEVERPVAELWIAAHPIGRLDRTLVIDGSTAWVAARTEAGTAELRTFALAWPDAAPPGAEPAGGEGADDEDAADAEDAPTDAAAEVPSLHATTVVDLGSENVLVARDVAYALRGPELHAAPLALPGELAAPPSLVATIDPPPTRLWACGDWVVAGSASAVSVVLPTLAVSPVPGVARARTVSPVPDVRPRQPLEGPSEGDEPIQLACTHDALGIGIVAEGGAAHVVRCTREACAPPIAIGDDVGGIAIDVAEPMRVATWHDDGPISFVSVEAGAASAPERVTACWERGRGLCGPIRFVAGGPWPLILGRDGTDATVLSLRDGEWQPLPGLGAPVAPPD